MFAYLFVSAACANITLLGKSFNSSSVCAVCVFVEVSITMMRASEYLLVVFPRLPVCVCVCVYITFQFNY